VPEIARIRWQSPPPTSIDEELVAYEDGTAFLVVRTPRGALPAIGTWRSAVSDDDRATLFEQWREVDLRHPVVDQVLAAAERIAAEARANPVATATFYAAVVPGDGVVLQAVGGGTGPAEFQLDADSVIVHVEDDGTEVAWHQMQRLQTGFVSPEPEGLGGLGRPAEIAPGAYGAIALSGPRLDAGGSGEGGRAVSIELTGYLRDGLPEHPSYQRFSVRTAPVPLPG
jgi:hypothetical protein